MTYHVGTHFDFTSQPKQSFKSILREVGEHIVFIKEVATSHTIEVTS